MLNIDTLLVAPRHVERSDFFGTFYETLKENEDVKKLRVSMYYNTGLCGYVFVFNVWACGIMLFFFFLASYVLFFGKLCGKSPKLCVNYVNCTTLHNVFK